MNTIDGIVLHGIKFYLLIEFDCFKSMVTKYKHVICYYTKEEMTEIDRYISMPCIVRGSVNKYKETMAITQKRFTEFNKILAIFQHIRPQHLCTCPIFFISHLVKNSFDWLQSHIYTTSLTSSFANLFPRKTFLIDSNR